MAIDHESQKPYPENKIKHLDKLFLAYFGFSNVFTELHNLPNSKVKFEIKMHIMKLLSEIVFQFQDEDRRASQNNNRNFAWAYLPIANGWRRLNENDFEKTEEGKILPNDSANRLGSLMYNFGAINFSLLNIISRSPYGIKYQNRYHRNLMMMTDSMGSQIRDKVSDAKSKIFWKTENMGFGNEDGEEPLIHIIRALYRGVP